MDNRTKKLASLLVNYSCHLEENEKLLIQYDGESARPLVKEIIRECYSTGALPFVNISDPAISREILMDIKDEQIETMTKHQLAQMKDMDAYIAVRASDNPFELSDVPVSNMNRYYLGTKEVLDYRVNSTKWVVLR